MEEKLSIALERGIEDMKNGRELPLKEAMEKVREIRDNRKQKKSR